jgi:hypothetical protein
MLRVYEWQKCIYKLDNANNGFIDPTHVGIDTNTIHVCPNWSRRAYYKTWIGFWILDWILDFGLDSGLSPIQCSLCFKTYQVKNEPHAEHENFRM